MIEQEVTVWSFVFKHTNHSVFKGEITATSVENRDTQALSLLNKRYRRPLPLSGPNGTMVFTLTEEGESK